MLKGYASKVIEKKITIKYRCPYCGNLHDVTQEKCPNYNYLNSEEGKLISKYWTKECTDRLKELASTIGKHYYWVIGNEFKSIIGEQKYESFKKDVEKLELSGRVRYVHVYYNIPLYYAEAVVEKENLPVKKFPIKGCKVCGRLCSKSDMLPRYINYIPKIFKMDLFYCNNCLDKAFLGFHKEEKTSDELKRDLSDLIDAFGFIPPQNIFNNPKLYRNVPEDKLKRVIPVLVRISDPKVYKKEFGSWLKALIKTGKLDSDLRPNVFGIMCVAKDGHDCLSLAEKLIDDWLSDNNIAHEKEPPYPKDIKLNPDGLLRADWKVSNILIEYFGLLGDRMYNARVKKKRQIAEKYQLSLIEIHPEDLYNLDSKLQNLISL